MIPESENYSFNIAEPSELDDSVTHFARFRSKLETRPINALKTTTCAKLFDWVSTMIASDSSLASYLIYDVRVSEKRLRYGHSASLRILVFFRLRVPIL